MEQKQNQEINWNNFSKLLLENVNQEFENLKKDSADQLNSKLNDIEPVLK